MKVDILKSFYGRPTGDVESDSTLFNEGATVEVPDDFGAMIVEKGLARASGGKAARNKEAVNETE